MRDATGPPSRPSRPSQMRGVIAPTSDVVDRDGALVSVTKWEAEAATYSSSLFQAAHDANHPDSLETSIVSHFNANPYSDWVYVRACTCIPTGYTCMRNKWKKHQLTKIKENFAGPPEIHAIQNLQTADEQCNNSCLWRMAGYEELPQYSWFAPGMPYHTAYAGGDDMTWFTEDTTWEEYEAMEACGRGLSPYFLGGFDYLHQAALGLGYPTCMREADRSQPLDESRRNKRCIWGPYAVACAIIEEKRVIRNRAGILFWRGAFKFIEGRTGPRVSDGRILGAADMTGRSPDMTEAMVRVAMIIAHSGGTNLDSLGIELRGNIFQRPVLTEGMCLDTKHPDRMKLADAQIVPRSMMWSCNTKINLDLERDIGLPIVLKSTKEIQDGHPFIVTRVVANDVFSLDVDPGFYRRVYRKLREGWSKDYNFVHGKLIKDKDGLPLRGAEDLVDPDFSSKDKQAQQKPQMRTASRKLFYSRVAQKIGDDLAYGFFSGKETSKDRFGNVAPRAEFHLLLVGEPNDDVDHYGRIYTKPASHGVAASVTSRYVPPKETAAPRAASPAAAHAAQDEEKVAAAAAQLKKDVDKKKARNDFDLANRNFEGQQERATDLLGVSRSAVGVAKDNAAPNIPPLPLIPPSLKEFKLLGDEIKKEFRSELENLKDFLEVKHKVEADAREQRAAASPGGPKLSASIDPATGAGNVDAADADQAEVAARKLWRKQDTGSARRESSAPIYRKYKERSPSSHQKSYPREASGSVRWSGHRESSQQTRRRSKSARRAVSTGPDPRRPAPDAFSRENLDFNPTSERGPIGKMGIFNVFDKMLGTPLRSRASFFMTVGDATREERPVMKDCGEYVLEYHDLEPGQWRGKGKTTNLVSGIGSIGDVALMAQSLIPKLSKFLAGKNLSDEFDNEPRNKYDNNKMLGILSNCCPPKSQLTVVRQLAQQSGGLLRPVISEREDQPELSRTVGRKAIEAIKAQFTGDNEEYDRDLRAEKRKVHQSRTNKLEKALRAPMPMQIKYEAYLPGWMWWYDSEPGELKNLFTAHPASTVTIAITVGRESAVTVEGDVFGHEPEELNTARVPFPGKVASHVALITQQLGRDAGISCRPVVFDIDCISLATGEIAPYSQREKQRRDAGEHPKRQMWGAGIEFWVTVKGMHPSEAMQSDPYAGTQYMQVYGLHVWTDTSKAPVWDFYIPGNSLVETPAPGAANHTTRFSWGQVDPAKREVVNQKTTHVKGPLRQMSIPASWSKTLDFAFGPLITQNLVRADNNIYEYTYLNNQFATSEKHVVEQGVPRKGLVRVTSPNIPMTTPWYATASCASTVPEIDKNHTFCYAFSLAAFLERDMAENYRNNETRWEIMHPLEPSLGGEYTVTELRQLSNPTNCCVVVPVHELAEDPNGPTYLRRFRQYYKVKADPPGGRSLVIGPADNIANNPNPALSSLADRLRAAIPISIPWDQEEVWEDDTPAEDDGAGDPDLGEGLEDDISYVSENHVSEIRPVTWKAEYIDSLAHAEDWIRDFFWSTGCSLDAGKAVMPGFPPPSHMYGGPGWLQVLIPELWKEVETFKLSILPVEEPPLMPGVEYADKRMRAMLTTPQSTITQAWFRERQDFVTGPTMKYEFDDAVAAKSMRHAPLVNYGRPLNDVFSLLYTLSELVGYVKSIRIRTADTELARATSLKREDILRWLTEVLKDPVAWNGLKTVRFDPESKYIKAVKQRLAWFQECTPPEYSVQKLILEEIPTAFWKNDEAYRRMTEMDADGEPTYKPNPDDPKWLGYGIVCQGINMWDPGYKTACTCCKGKEAPIFLGLESMKVCMVANYPQASGAEAISRLYKALTPLMRHTDVTHRKPPVQVDESQPPVHVHEVGVYTRLYTSPRMQHRFLYLMDVAQFQEYTATWAWFLWNFRSLKGDHRRFVDQMTSTWTLYRAIGKKDWRQIRAPPSDPVPVGPHGQPAGNDATQGNTTRPMETHVDTYIRDIRSVCGQEMEVGESLHKRLKDANILPESR